MLICTVVGARPNYIKIAPVVHELIRRKIPQVFVHTGQHYDKNMFDVFFEELELPKPDIYLGVGSDSHSKQTARIMVAFEEICNQHRPDLVVVGGDVNSTLAVSLVAAKANIPVAHIESGLRSFDRTMPEEINRIVTDHLSDLLFTTEESANRNLRKEGISKEKIHFVGNCMVDTLLRHVDTAVQSSPWEKLALEPSRYAMLTLHRPSNVDDSDILMPLMQTIAKLPGQLPILFPVHPRTREHLSGLKTDLGNYIRLCEPMPYLTFLGLMAKAAYILTDSGGIQEETTILNVPCLTLRWNTERPITIESGTNRLVGTDPQKIQDSVKEILAGKWSTGKKPPLWDGKAYDRIVDIIQSWSNSPKASSESTMSEKV
jgi:UDP-N-acetylglucosamine 2-epimerase (non-hydrolysing)